MCIEHIKHSESQEHPETCQGKLSEKEGSQKESYLGSTKALVCPTQRCTLSENQWEGA